MVSFPNCKINIGLNITEKRTDGFHNLETIFYPVPFYDVLELIVSKDAALPPFLLETSGLEVQGSKEDNICYKAYELVKDKMQNPFSLQMHLLKNIPMGAGLGGGSADGAYALKLLNEKLRLDLSSQQLEQLALELGSDCPFFIRNKPCYASGRGERMEEINLDLSGYYLVLVNPGIHIHTGKAFSLIRPQKPIQNLRELIQLPLKEWQGNIVNDFEEPVMHWYPGIKAVKKQLLDAGALYVSMTGSGSTVYAIFDREIEVSFPQEHFCKRLAL